MSSGATQQKYGTVITAAGRAAIASALATGTLIDIKYIILGDGGGVEYYPGESQEALRNQVYQIEANHVYVDPGNPNWIVVEGMIPERDGGFTIREAAIKTANGTVIAVGSYPSSYKPKLEEGSAIGIGVRFILEVTNASVVNMKIDPSTVYATITYVDNRVSGHARETNAHGGTYEPMPSRLMLRNSEGRCQVANPVEEKDAANKSWTEGKIAELVQGVIGFALVRRGSLHLLAESFDELPPGYYFANGNRHAEHSPVGAALLALPEGTRRNLKITLTAAGVNLPNAFSEDGRGVFFRAVNGTTELPGVIQQDAARAITATASSSGTTRFSSGTLGEFSYIVHPKDIRHTPTAQVYANGAFRLSEKGTFNYGEATDPNGPYGWGSVEMNFSGVSATTTVGTSVSIAQQNVGAENRPLYMGLTPAIFLGV